MKNIIVLLLMAVVIVTTTTCQKEFESGGITDVVIDKEVLYLVKGGKANLTATVEPESAAQDVVWTTSNSLVATVSQSGEVNAISAGVAYIVAASKKGKRAGTCTVFVDPIPVTGITMTSSLDMLVHDAVTLEPVITPADAADKFVRWTSSDATVASVSILGEVKALLPGTTEIIATTRDGNFEAKCFVTVTKIPVESVTLDKTDLVVYEGDRVSLKVTVTPDDASFPEVTWSSSNTTYATVNQNGDVTIRRAGLVTITAIADGVKAECKIVVYPPIQQGYDEKVIWLDEMELSWDAQGIPIANIGDNLKEGTILRFYFLSLGDKPKLKLFYGDWDGPIIIDDPNFKPGGSDNLIEIPTGSAYYDIVVTEEMVEKMLNPSWGSNALLVQGADATVFKITVLNEVPLEFIETVVYDEAHTQGWDGKYVPLAKLVDADIKVGSILKFYFTDTGAQCQVYAGDWDPMFIEFNLAAGLSEYELTVTEAMLERIMNPSWGNSGLVFQGQFTFIKLTLINVVSPETVLWTGSAAIDWTVANSSFPIDVSLLKPGQILGIDFELDANWGQIRVYGGSWWELLPSWGDLGFPDNCKAFSRDDTNFEFKISQADIDCIVKQGNILFIAGDVVVIKRLYVL